MPGSTNTNHTWGLPEQAYLEKQTLTCISLLSSQENPKQTREDQVQKKKHKSSEIFSQSQMSIST